MQLRRRTPPSLILRLASLAAALLAVPALAASDAAPPSARARFVALPGMTDTSLAGAVDLAPAVRAGTARVALPAGFRLDGRPYDTLVIGAGHVELLATSGRTAALEGPAAGADRRAGLRLDVLAHPSASLGADASVMVATTSSAVSVRWIGLAIDGEWTISEIVVTAPSDVVIQYLHVPPSVARAAAAGRVHAGDAIASLLPQSTHAFRLRQRGGAPALRPLPVGETARPKALGPAPPGCAGTPGTWCDFSGSGAQVFLNESFDDGMSTARGWTGTDQWHEIDFTTCAPGATNFPGRSWYYGNDATCTYDNAPFPPPRRDGSLLSPVFGPVTANSQFVFSSRWQVETNPVPPPDFDLAQIFINGLLLGGMPDTTDPTAWFNFNPISLNPFAGMTVQIEFFMEVDDSISFLGWMIDDVVAWDPTVGTPECIVNAGHGTWTSCDVRQADEWHFNEGAFCASCFYSFYVLVECGREMHLPLDDMEGAEVRVTNVITGQPVSLTCRNLTSVADAGQGPYPAFPLPATAFSNLDCGAPPGDDLFWGPPFDETDNFGPGSVTWGFDSLCASFAVYDRDLDGAIECPEVPGPGGELPLISPGELQTMDCSIADPSGLCGLYRVDIVSGGFDWFLFANCDGTGTPRFPIFLDCSEAWLAYNPLPEIAIANLTASNTCPATLQVDYDIVNLGCTPHASDVIIEIRSNCVPEDSQFVIVPGPFPANSTTHDTQMFDVTCSPVRIDVISDPSNLIPECTEAANAASCDAEAGVDALSTFTCGCSAQLDANAGPDLLACPGATVLLDGSRSTGAGCPSQLLYRWLDGTGAELRPFDPLPTFPVTLTSCPTPSTYTLEIQCEGEVCVDSDTITVSCLEPVAAAGPDFAACAGEQVVLDGSGSSVPGCAQLQYRWLDGAGTEIGPWTGSPFLDLGIFDCGLAGDYTVEVRCTTGGACTASDGVNVSCVEVLAAGGPDLPVCERAPINIVGASTSEGCTEVVYSWFVDDPGGPVQLTPFSTDPTLAIPAGLTGCPGVLPLLFVAVCNDPGFLQCGTVDSVLLDCTRPGDPVPVFTQDCGLVILQCGISEPGVTYSWDLDVAADADADTVPDNDVDRSTCDVPNVPFPAGDTTARVTARDANGCTSFTDLVVTATSGAIPAEIQGLRLNDAGDAVDLFWSPDPNAVGYHLTRGDLNGTVRSLWTTRTIVHGADPASGAGACAHPLTNFTDPDDGAARVNYFYLVTGVGACGDEGPGGQSWNRYTYTPHPARTPSASCP